ncbi:MAG: hypothetical protein ISR22_03795 [Candidatus Poseidoniaceae archaeon]|nr:hypothetical protein [Candidatus Poseidoniaceae archaeon]
MAKRKPSNDFRSLELPDPYGHGFERSEDPLEHTRSQWEKLESRRRLAGNITRNRFLLFWRSVAGLILAFFSLLGVLFPQQISEESNLVFLLPVPILLATLPSIIASESAWHAMQARLSLREQGGFSSGSKHALRVQPGMDRILDGLKDHRRNNLVSTVLIGLALGLMLLSLSPPPGSVAWNLALVIAMSSGFLYTFHAQHTLDYVRQLGDKFSNLVFHAPTHHPTQLGSILGDLLVTHLDPDLYLEWREWRKQFDKSLIPGYDKRQALERLLYILYLHNEDVLPAKRVPEELSVFMKHDTIKEILLEEGNRFNWRTLQRLISHAKAWQPSAFELLDRLQNDLLVGQPELIRSKWRMDVSIDEKSIDGSTNLFIALNNQTFEPRHVKVEVLVPNGEPKSRDHRFELKPCPPPRQEIKLSNSSDEDALDWIPRYLQKGVVLWINVAWNRRFSGNSNIQVILRDDDGIILESKVLTTFVERNSADNTRERVKRLELARKIGELSIPNVDFR